MMKYLVTMDVPLLNLLLMWKTMFADDLFADAEETYLYTRLLRDGHHQSLPITQRLLCLHWLEQFIEVSPLAASMQSQQHHLLVPTALDSSDLRLQKLRILTACYDDSSDVDTRLLISSLGIQRKLVHYSQSGKYGPALFRVLYTYFSRHPGTELAAEVCRFVEVLVQAEPFLMPHVLDFLKCVQKTEVQGSCYHQMLLCILEQVTQHDMAVVQENLSYHLMLLKEAAAQPSVSSQKIIQLLLSVCESTPILTEGDLLVGHQLIGVCRSLLQTHPTRDMFEELADLLHTVFTRSNDVGIQSKAKFYYAMLVKLPDSQIKDLLVKAPSTGSDSWKSMANLMSEDVSIPERVCVIKFDNPILQLTRKTESLDKSFRLAVAVDSKTGDDSTLFTRYITSMKSAVLPSIEIPASLTFPPNQDAVKRFYAGILTIDRDEDYEAIAEYIVVYMDAAAMPSHDILLTFTPLRPSPTSFRLRFTFTDMEGRTCLSMLSPFQLRFDDLFLPLPIIDGAACNKLQLFNCLWQSFYNVCSFNTDPSCASSIVVLMLPQEQMMSILSADLKEYVIALEYEECVSVGIVLPPSSHVLFKMVIEAEKTIVHIATDNWEILPLINRYLLDMQATGKPADS
ncbi:PREDICTED: AP-5 complex subunit beta-1-like [Priapulus caudatus]|uniref:AP-5 complex subunit beta-1-like n=1 Tax=Priapulus caudatus TaxID=37621 RepID=A0ABM1EIS7_PRICU|nr:PREDICTED: AP-5 complex subunit beta-1-like [Priapulus caudatus]